MNNKQKVLVTGAGGFIGGRVVEVLHCSGQYHVRAGVRRWASAARIGRLPVEIVQCDIVEPEQVRAALAEVSAVVHCARGSAETDLEGTDNVLSIGLEAGLQSFVALSSIAVYGSQSGDIDEECPCITTGNEYGSMKVRLEQLCMDYAPKGLPVSILRPTIVYGPFSESWTVEPAARLKSGRFLIPEDYGAGTCNLVYVDDLVAAIMLSLRRVEAAGEVFNVNGAERLTWNDYFKALNDAMGLPPLKPHGRTSSRLAAATMMPVRKSAKAMLKYFPGPIKHIYQHSAHGRALMKRAEQVIRTTPTSAEFDLYSRKAFYLSKKAERLLGYRPRFALTEGVELSAAWLRHHRLI
jgi:nucleoside-diphosphate-sugar epimerase